MKKIIFLIKRNTKQSLATMLIALITFYSCSNDDNNVGQLPPIIKKIIPNKGKIGTAVKITGENFGTRSDKIIFKFNGEKAKIISIKDTELQVEVPDGAETGKVSLTTTGNKIEGPEFTVVIPLTITDPSITSIDPTSGEIGSLVTVEGTNFGSTIDDITFYFNGTKAEVKSATDKKLEVVVPKDAKTGNVSVSTKQGKTEGPEFTVGVKPTIKRIRPNIGIVDSEVRIIGKNFGETKEDVTIYFNDIKAEIIEFRIVGDLGVLVLVKVPSGATTGKISVSTAIGKAEGPLFAVAEGPKIISVEPTSAETGTMITIKGTNFDQLTGQSGADIGYNPIFYFNGEKAKLISQDEKELKVIVPSDATTGKVSISTEFGNAEGPSFTVLPRTDKDVYIAGTINDKPVYWKNGEVFYLEEDIPVQHSGSASVITISDGDVHIAGHIDNRVVYWKNGKVVFSSDEGELVIPKAIVVNRRDVHIVAWTVFGINGMIYWKNGSREVINPSKGVSEINPDDMVVVGNDVYISGHQIIYRDDIDGVFRKATYWKNGIPISITDTTNGIWSEALTIEVIGDDIYLAGYENNSATVGSGSKGKIWKNGKEITVVNRSEIIDMEIRGDDVHFITGSSYHKNNNLVTEILSGNSFVIDDSDVLHVIGHIFKEKQIAYYRNKDGIINYLADVYSSSEVYDMALGK